MTQYVLAAVLGVLFALGTYLVLRRDVVRVVWGVTLMSQGANAYLITVGGVSPGDVAPIVHDGAANTTDPLVQALVLTAIVIGFGTTAFSLVLTYRVYQEHGTIDLDDISRAEDGEIPGQEGDAVAADGGAPAGHGRDGAAGAPGGETDG